MLDSSQEYFVEDFLHPCSWEIWSEIFIFANVFARFWYQHNVDLTKYILKCPYLFNFLKVCGILGLFFPLIHWQNSTVKPPRADFFFVGKFLTITSNAFINLFIFSVYYFNIGNIWFQTICPFHLFIKNFFPFIFISWSLITLQYCSGFCHALTWISHGVTCIPHPDPPSHLPLHPIPLGLPSAPAPSTCLMHPTWAGDLFHPR